MKVFKKADIIIIALIIAVGTSMGLFLSFGKASADQVRITIENQVYGTYDIFSNNTILIENQGLVNEILIEDGKVMMKEANCQGQDCIHQGEKESAGETIICLPNQVMVELLGEEKEFDSITK